MNARISRTTCRTEEDFTPGFLTIAARNDTGETLAGLLVTADAMFFNDQDRSTLWNFQGSVDDVNYSTLFSLQSIEARDANPAWVAEPVGGEISLAPGLPTGGAFFIRVAGSDLGGTGDRDEFALNNLSITGLTSLTVIPEPSGLAALCVCCGVVAVRRRHRH